MPHQVLPQCLKSTVHVGLPEQIGPVAEGTTAIPNRPSSSSRVRAVEG
jgi:hypothetical protein